jgi:uncharacterized membrane protein YkvA (DUF1232 family)
MSGSRHTAALSGWGCRLGISCAIVLALRAAVAAGMPAATGLRPIVSGANVNASIASGFTPLHRLTVRAEHSMYRLVVLAGTVGAFWLWVVVSLAAFLTVAGFASAADRRMLALRHKSPGAATRYLGFGIRTFFLMVLDRGTPYAARIVLAVGLLYWLVPFDLIVDKSFFPGFLDDLVVAVVAAKAFVYLCPASLVAKHACAVEARAQRRRRLPSSPKFMARR